MKPKGRGVRRHIGNTFSIDSYPWVERKFLYCTVTISFKIVISFVIVFFVHEYFSFVFFLFFLWKIISSALHATTNHVRVLLFCLTSKWVSLQKTRIERTKRELLFWLLSSFNSRFSFRDCDDGVDDVHLRGSVRPPCKNSSRESKAYITHREQKPMTFLVVIQSVPCVHGPLFPLIIFLFYFIFSYQSGEEKIECLEITGRFEKFQETKSLP